MEIKAWFDRFGSASNATLKSFNDRTPLPAARAVKAFSLIFHPTCVIKPAVDGCPLVATTSMEIQKVRSLLLQIREKDHAAPLGGIVRVILCPFVVFPK